MQGLADSWQVAKKLARATRAGWSRLKDRCRALLYWIRGRVGIQGNEDADEEAKAAAKGSQDGEMGGGGWRWIPFPLPPKDLT